MVRILPASLAALLVATPFVLGAQQSAPQPLVEPTPLTIIALPSVRQPAPQPFGQPSAPAIRLGTRQLKAKRPAVEVINIKVDPARLDSLTKAEKAKNDKNDKKKKGAKASYKTSPTNLRAEPEDESANQTWETEFMVDHADRMQDRMLDRASAKSEK